MSPPTDGKPNQPLLLFLQGVGVAAGWAFTSGLVFLFFNWRHWSEPRIAPHLCALGVGLWALGGKAVQRALK